MDIARLVLEYLKVLVWPLIVLTLALIFRTKISILIGRIRRAELPGGTALDFQEQINEARQLVQKIEAAPKPEKHQGPSIPLTEANARMMKLGLRPSPSGLDMTFYRDLSRQDPALALAGLRIELDILAKNLATGFKVPHGKFDSGMRLLRLLASAGAITPDQLELARQVFQLCNAAVHGESVSCEAALSVIDIADALTDQYLAWLSWGFEDGWHPVRTNIE